MARDTRNRSMKVIDRLQVSLCCSKSHDARAAKWAGLGQEGPRSVGEFYGLGALV